MPDVSVQFVDAADMEVWGPDQTPKAPEVSSRDDRDVITFAFASAGKICNACHKPISVGEEICYGRLFGRLYHAKCPPAEHVDQNQKPIGVGCVDPEDFVLVQRSRIEAAIKVAARLKITVQELSGGKVTDAISACATIIDQLKRSLPKAYGGQDPEVMT